MRKTLILMLLGSTFAATASAQIARGTVMAGGSVGVSTQQFKNNTGQDSAESGSVSLSPSVGLFVRDNLAVGVRLGYGGSTSQNQGSELKSRNFSFDLFARKYLSLGKGFYLFGEGSAGFSRYKTETLSAVAAVENTATTNGFLISAYPGISYAVGRRLQLEAGLSNLLSIGYTVNRFEYTALPNVNTSKNTGFNAGVGIGSNIPLNLGFRLFFGK